MNSNHQFPVKLGVTKRKFGTERSIDVLYADSDAEFVQTQDWRLTAIGISGDLRERLDINEIDETKIIGHVDVDPESLDWEFVPKKD